MKMLKGSITVAKVRYGKQYRATATGLRYWYFGDTPGEAVTKVLKALDLPARANKRYFITPVAKPPHIPLPDLSALPPIATTNPTR